MCTCMRLGIYFYQNLKIHIQREMPSPAVSWLIYSIIALLARGGMTYVAALMFTVLICHSVRKKGK